MKWLGIFLSLGITLGVLRLTHQPLKERILWSTAVYDEKEELLRLTLSADEKYRLYTRLDELPAGMLDAIIFKEDKHFRQHWGVNPLSLLRAAFRTYVVGDRRIGGSTISMQLARLLYHSQSRSLFGKSTQLLRALWLETVYSKDEILEAYLNLLPYGSNVEGLGTASLIYLNKKPQRLNLPEVLALSVIPQSPKLRSVGPRGQLSQHSQLIIARNKLYELYAKDFPVTEQDRLNLQIPLKMQGTKDLPFLAPHFVEDLLSKKDPLSSEIHTTLKGRTQRLLESRIKSYVEQHGNIGVTNASAMLVDWTTNEVKALVGSANYFDDQISGQVNGTKAYRSPGSTLKPFAYALAFDQGLVHNQSLLKDAPVSFGGFDPENFDRDFQGPISVEQALIRSRNLPAVQITAALKNPSFYEFLKKSNVQNMQPEEFYGLSTILGGLEVSMEDLVKMYSMLPNLGKMRQLKKLKSDNSSLEGNWLTPESSFMVLDILRQLPRPSSAGGSPWARENVDVYWKTGTSQGFRDAWSLGIVGKYVLAIWVGNFDGSSNPAFVGKDIAAPLFFEVVDGLRAVERLDSPLVVPADLNLQKIQVCALSGQMPGPNCPHQKSTWFIPGISPISTCDIHRKILLDPKSGLRLCNQLDQQGQAQVFEFWPSDLLKLFAKAGLNRAKPPAWDPRCQLRDLATSGTAPKITSPTKDVTYTIRATGHEQQEIALSAIADADVRETFWFVDGSLVGKTGSGRDLFWQASPGFHQVRVVDDQGRADVLNVKVEVVN